MGQAEGVSGPTQGSTGPPGGGTAPPRALTFPRGWAVREVGKDRRGREGAPWLGRLPGSRTTTSVTSAPIPTFTPRILSNLDQTRYPSQSYTSSLPEPEPQLHPFPSPTSHHRGPKHKPPPLLTGQAALGQTLAGADLAHPNPHPLGEKDLPTPTGKQLYRKGLRVTRHLLTIIFPSGLTVIIVQTCLGEEPRARPDAPSLALLLPRPGHEPAAGRSRVRATRGLSGFAARAVARGVGAASAGRGRGARRGCRRAARAPGRAVSASLPSPLHILGSGRRRAPRPPATRLPARARSLGGTAPRRADGLPAAVALIPGPAPSVPATGGPGPAPRPLAPPGRAAPGPRAALRPWLRARAPCARPASRSFVCPRSGVRRPAPRCVTPGGAALFPWRRRPSSGWGGPGAAAALLRRAGATSWLRPSSAFSRPGAGRGGRGAGGEGRAAGRISEASRVPPALRAEACFGSCRAQRRSALGGDPRFRAVPGPSLLSPPLPLPPQWASAMAPSHPQRFLFANFAQPLALSEQKLQQLPFAF